MRNARTAILLALILTSWWPAWSATPSRSNTVAQANDLTPEEGEDLPATEEFDYDAEVEDATQAEPKENPSSSEEPDEIEDQQLQTVEEAEDETPPGVYGDSQPVFDWSKHRNQPLVPHPYADKGLFRITKEREYLYKVDPSPQKTAMSFRFGMFDPVNLENPDRAGKIGATFEENYDQTDTPALFVDFEWQLWRTPIGKIGLRAGGGLYIAQGHGHFVSDINQGLIPREIFTFTMIPATLGAVYRLQMWHKQLLIPYGEGGGMLIGFSEFRDDDKPPKFGGSAAGYFAGGVAMNLTYFDYVSRIALDREYGINAAYLTVEYRGIVDLIQTYDFSSDLFNAGLLLEY